MAGIHYTARNLGAANRLAEEILAYKPRADVYINLSESQYGEYYAISVRENETQQNQQTQQQIQQPVNVPTIA